MKFKDYVKCLQETINENPEIGEFKAVYSSDDEGNGFQEVFIDCVATGIFDESEGDFIDNKEDLDEMEKDGEDITFNAVCIN